MELWNAGIIELLADSDPSLLMGILTQVGLWAKVAIGIGLVIFVHELGHFVAAKSCGVKCEKFYVGFDVPISIGPIKFPRTLGKFKWGETEYGLGIIPLGGYVKMLGQDDDPRKAAEENERIRIANENAQPGDEESPQYTLDPRSFQAKSVLQRMFIISAGVVVNVITAVMFAAAAFWYGVPYTPAIIGSVRAGDPAWIAGIQPGSQIISVGTIKDNPKLQFRDMTMEILEQGLADKTKAIPLTVRKGDQEVQYQLVATPRHDPKQKQVAIGVASQSSSTLSSNVVAYPNSSAASVLDDSFRGAQAIEINGQDLPKTGEDIYSTPIDRAIRKAPDAPIDLTFVLKDGTTKQITLPPQPLKTIGASFAVGPVTAVVKGGSAELAGVLAGDQIIKFQKYDQLSAFELQRLAFQNDGSAEIVVQRSVEDGKNEQHTFVVQPDSTDLVSGDASKDLALGRYGIAFAVSNKLASVDPDGPLAEVFAAGDLVTRIIIEKGDEVQWNEVQEFAKKAIGLVPPILAGKPWDVDSYHTIPAMVHWLQVVPVGTPIRVFGIKGSADVAAKSAAGNGEDPELASPVDQKRNGQIIDTIVELKASPEQYWNDRGLIFEPLKRIHVADSLVDATTLGYNEAIHRGKGVLRFLKMLFTGQLNADMLGGPVAIFSIAGSHAAEGIPRLLMFLTFLSINLAILNFLPIPALDGGHMVFLVAEAALGRPVDEEWQARLTMVGVLMLLGLMAFAFYNDIARLIG